MFRMEHVALSVEYTTKRSKNPINLSTTFIFIHLHDKGEVDSDEDIGSYI